MLNKIQWFFMLCFPCFLTSLAYLLTNLSFYSKLLFCSTFYSMYARNHINMFTKYPKRLKRPFFFLWRNSIVQYKLMRTKTLYNETYIKIIHFDQGEVWWSSCVIIYYIITFVGSSVPPPFFGHSNEWSNFADLLF